MGYYAVCRSCSRKIWFKQEEEWESGYCPKCKQVRRELHGWLRKVESVARKFYKLVKAGKV